jgi:hypothetical protein
VPREAVEAVREGPGLCLTGVGAEAGGVAVEGEAVLLSFGCGAESPSDSAKMLSSRASTPATACDRKDPHLDDCFDGAAMSQTMRGEDVFLAIEGGRVFNSVDFTSAPFGNGAGAS